MRFLQLAVLISCSRRQRFLENFEGKSARKENPFCLGVGAKRWEVYVIIEIALLNEEIKRLR